MFSIKYIFKVFYTFLILDLVETLQHLHSAWAKPLSFLPRTRIQTSTRTINKHIIHQTSTVNNIFNVLIKFKPWNYTRHFYDKNARIHLVKDLRFFSIFIQNLAFLIFLILHLSNPTFIQSYIYPILHLSNPTFIKSYIYPIHFYPILHLSNPTFIQSYFYPILHLSNPTFILSVQSSLNSHPL